ncbi:ankyrin, partial [Coprinopsis marcescibilis]
TPLIRASEYGDLDAVKLLLGDVDIEIVNATDTDGWSALTHASRKGHVEVVRAILGFQSTRTRMGNAASDSQDGLTALMYAAYFGHTAVVEELLRVRDDIDVNHCSTHPLYKGSALVYASQYGHRDIVQLLVDHPGVDLNVVGRNGLMALGWARENQHKEIEELLYSRGAQERRWYR